MRVTTDEMEIRGKEQKTSKSGNEYIVVRAEDETGLTYELCDKNVSNFDKYTKGKTCRLVLDITMGKFTNIEIKNILD